MTVLLPRLDREQTQSLIEVYRELPVEEVAARMPIADVITTTSDLGGLEIDASRLTHLRELVLAAADECGYPDGSSTTSDTRMFEARCARLLHSELGISPHEAADEAVWSHLTVCWFMDVALWRWGASRDDRRFRGDVNRNTFRRLWWRAEVFGPHFDLAALGEDEFVNVMERPSIASNRRLTRALAASFLARTNADPRTDRMMLMRDICKHVVRLMPIVDFDALGETELAEVIEAVLDAASTRSRLVLPAAATVAPVPSPCVEPIQPLVVTQTSAEMAAGDLPADIAELAHVAIGIARRAGRVTSVGLCEAVPQDLQTQDARRILQALVERGDLRRRGKTKGTYYVVPAEDNDSELDTHAPVDAVALPEQQVRGALRASDLSPTAEQAGSDRLEREANSDAPSPPSATTAPRPPERPSGGAQLRPGRPTVSPAVARQALRRLLGR